MTNASMIARWGSRAPRAGIVMAAAPGGSAAAADRGRVSGARVRRPALRPLECNAGLQRHERELAPQLGARSRDEPCPEPVPLAQRALQRAGLAREPLQIRQRQCTEPIDLASFEP